MYGTIQYQYVPYITLLYITTCRRSPRAFSSVTSFVSSPALAMPKRNPEMKIVWQVARPPEHFVRRGEEKLGRQF